MWVQGWTAHLAYLAFDRFVDSLQKPMLLNFIFIIIFLKRPAYLEEVAHWPIFDIEQPEMQVCDRETETELDSTYWST